jgi:hypothetical protein
VSHFRFEALSDLGFGPPIQRLVPPDLLSNSKLTQMILQRVLFLMTPLVISVRMTITLGATILLAVRGMPPMNALGLEFAGGRSCGHLTALQMKTALHLMILYQTRMPWLQNISQC